VLSLSSVCSICVDSMTTRLRLGLSV
jgi:hypothetical protein